MHLALAAYFRALMDSSLFHMDGEMLTNMSVFADPPRLSCMSCVSLWLRYGIIFAFDVKAIMTSPKALSDLLISMASRWDSPTAPLFARRSLPARSTIVIFPDLVRPLALSVMSNVSMSNKCDLEESEFMSVDRVFRLPRPMATTCAKSSDPWTKMRVAPSNRTVVLPSGWRTFLNSSFAGSLDRDKRSRKSDKYSSTMEACTSTEKRCCSLAIMTNTSRHVLGEIPSS
mmetsp:Transcript_40119/g.106428  ORF Transcript_40119/g.106428 Transcript_40119/m.106428 type:complete len:229 (+) Transcript_40119:511-1197(+)